VDFLVTFTWAFPFFLFTSLFFLALMKTAIEGVEVRNPEFCFALPFSVARDVIGF
jgi:hypothetical protein